MVWPWVQNGTQLRQSFHLFNENNGPKPELYRRYIDDCISATPSTREKLNQSITAVNSFHLAPKYA